MVSPLQLEPIFASHRANNVRESGGRACSAQRRFLLPLRGAVEPRQPFREPILGETMRLFSLWRIFQPGRSREEGEMRPPGLKRGSRADPTDLCHLRILRGRNNYCNNPAMTWGSEARTNCSCRIPAGHPRIFRKTSVPVHLLQVRIRTKSCTRSLFVPNHRRRDRKKDGLEPGSAWIP